MRSGVPSLCFSTLELKKTKLQETEFQNSKIQFL